MENNGRQIVKTFRLHFFVSQYRKMSYGNPLKVDNFRVSKNFMLQWVISRFTSFFCLKISYTFLVEPYSAMFHKFSGSEKVYG